jgi:hypothetical protein
MSIPERELYIVLRELRALLDGDPWNSVEHLKKALDDLFETAEKTARAPFEQLPEVVNLVHQGCSQVAASLLHTSGGCSLQEARALIAAYTNAIAGKELK